MKENKKNSSTSEGEEDDIEKMLETTWNNLESRRSCEQKHVPEYIKRIKKDEKK